MAKKKIATIGFELASDDVQYLEFGSGKSLLDWDIVLIKPVINEYILYGDSYKGKPSLSDYRSFQLKEDSEHWRREIKDSVESGKTVFVYLTDFTEVYIDTGERKYSGTGRNQKTTRIVTEYDNYKCIPINSSPISTTGSSMKLSQRGAILSSYWKEFEKKSTYRVTFKNDEIQATIVTKNGDKPVSVIYQNKNSSGALILLPDIDFYHNSLIEEDEDKEEYQWTKEAYKFAAKLISEVVSIDIVLKSEGQLTPKPEWVKNKAYDLEVEKKLKAELLRIESKIEALNEKKEKISDQLKDAGRLKNLLFEKGKPLEYAIVDALKILGFKVSQYQDSESEFDVVFECKEGRLIGEAEGKDNKAINITKLRQLEMNILEDLEREGIEEPAKAVLIGNAQRLLDLSEREEPFTKKCMSAATRSSTALLFAPDLFEIAKYLSDNRDKRFATRCRKAILSAVCNVKFPKIPKSEAAVENEHVKT